MKRVQRWVSIIVSAAILSSLVACGAADDKGQTQLATTQAPAGSVQELFGSSLFVGDSIIGGLTNDDLLPEANVMGDWAQRSNLRWITSKRSRAASRRMCSCQWVRTIPGNGRRKRRRRSYSNTPDWSIV